MSIGVWHNGHPFSIPLTVSAHAEQKRACPHGTNAIRRHVEPVGRLRTFRLPRVGPGHPSSPLVHLLPHLFPLSLFPFFHWLYLFSSFVHPFPFYQNSPLRFQAGGRRKRPNLVLVCFLFCTLCYLYSLVKMYCGALFYLV